MRSFTLYTKLVLAQLICGLLFTQTATAQNTILYGMTQNGGADSLGAIIGYNLTTGNESLLWSFGKDSDGQSPTGSLVYCPLNGLLYGLTVSGGSYQLGAVISFNPATNTEAVAWSFGHAVNSVASTYGDLVYDATNQLFYGMSFGGGANNTGTVFSFNPATDSIKQIWHFGFGAGPALPYGNLVLDPNNGLYYGMTYEGGSTDGGAILTLNTLTDTVRKVFNFNDGQGGESPYGSLVWLPSTSLFYGVTSAGGPDSLGVLFSYNPVDSVETVLHNFGSGNDAAGPLRDLIYDQNAGLFYGLSIDGGVDGQGTIYSFNPTTDSEAVLYSFGSVANDGSFPNGSLIYDPTNQLYYGMAQTGGTHQYGTVFSFNPANNAETTLWSLGAGFDGAEPQGSLLLLDNGYPAGITRVNNNKINLYPNPGNGSFVLQSQNAIGVHYNIYNTIGKNVQQGTITSDIQNITLNGAPDGMYVLMINYPYTPVPVSFVVAK
jgi:uncharacterized repeat protein (TIGR03803 family)